jgi:MFS family permease
LLLLTAAEAGVVYARTALGPLQETMQPVLGFSDNQMAVIQGPALALPMAIAAIPIGLVIDRHSRSRLVLALVALALIGSALTAAASGFKLLIVARCLVGLAAPATAIAICALIADLYAPDQRGRATTVMSIGGLGGMSAAFAFGGYLLTRFGADDDGWRWAMFSMTLPLIPLSVLMLKLREPPRTGIIERNPSLWAVRLEIWRFRHVILPLLVGQAMVGIADGAALVWAAPALSRQFAVPPAQVGALMATALLVSGILGPIAGGVIADVCHRRGGPRLTAWVLAGFALASALASLFMLMPSVVLAAAAFGVFMMIGTGFAVASSTVATVAIPNELRGTCLALMSATAAIFGFGLAPLMVSGLSGALGGPETIGYALAWVCVVTNLIGAATFAAGTLSLPRTAN